MGKLMNIGLTAKLTITVILSSILIYLVIFGLGYSFTDRVIIKQVDEIGKNDVDIAVKRIDEVVEAVARTSKNVNFMLESSSINKNELFEIIQFSISNNPELSGLSISFEPYAANPKDKFYSPYCYKKGKDVQCEMLGGKDYDYFKMKWYEETKASKHAFWTDPYYDYDCSNIFVLSHSAPFFKRTKNGNIFQGAVSADISLDWLQNTISNAAFLRKGYVFLISRQGTFITFPVDGYSLQKTIWDIANKHNDKGLNTIAREMTSGKTGIGPLKDFVTGENSWIFYKPVQLSDWSIGVVFKEKELYADLVYMAHRMLALCILGIIILFGAIFILSRRITKPLNQLSSAVGQIAL